MNSNEQYFLKEQDGVYYFYKKPNTVVTTPKGDILTADTHELAERIVFDLNEYGTDYFGADSILPWQYTYVENFSKMDKDRVIDILVESFLQDSDWTFATNNEAITSVFGLEEVRIQEMRDWLEKLSIKQLTAACCIGNAYHSLGIAYIFAKYLTECNEESLESNIEELGMLIETLTDEFTAFDVVDDFETFKLYYSRK